MSGTRNLRRIVFFWKGQDLTWPTILVLSLRRTFGADMEVVQLSDPDTPQVEGVTRCQRMKLPAPIMMARIQAYSTLEIAEPTLFMDADMMVVKPFDLPPLQANEVGVTPRDDHTLINWHMPVDFPEFENKYFDEEMPYIGSFVYTASPEIFRRQLEGMRKMVPRLQQWYGDQVTLKAEIDSGRFVRRDINVRHFNRTVRTVGEFNVLLGTDFDVCIVHFKGPKGKEIYSAVTKMTQGAPRRPAAGR